MTNNDPAQNTLKLNDGHTMPTIGFGTGGIAFYLKECAKDVRSALEIGYRCLDSAEVYGNASSIQEGIKGWGGKREDLYIITKCGPEDPEAEAEDPRVYLEKALRELGVAYVDMYLIHFPHNWPIPLSEAWRILESLKVEGLARSIGVSNFQEKDILEIQDTWTIPPAINQIELHPYIIHYPKFQRLLSLLQKHDIKVVGNDSLGSVVHYPGHGVDEVVARVASERPGATVNQVLMAWSMSYSRGGSITTSRDPGRRAEYLASGGIMPALMGQEVEEISLAGESFTAPFRQAFWNDDSSKV